MDLKDTNTEDLSSITLSATSPDFAINDSTGTTAALIDDSGNLSLLGKVIENVSF